MLLSKIILNTYENLLGKLCSRKLTILSSGNLKHSSTFDNTSITFTVFITNPNKNGQCSNNIVSKIIRFFYGFSLSNYQFDRNFLRIFCIRTICLVFCELLFLLLLRKENKSRNIKSLWFWLIVVVLFFHFMFVFHSWSWPRLNIQILSSCFMKKRIEKRYCW